MIRTVPFHRDHSFTHRIKADISEESLNESSDVNLELVETQDV